MLDVDRFIADCRDAMVADRTHRSVREVVARAISDPVAIIAAMGEPQRAGLYPVYRSPELTILNLVWGPHMVLLPHDHRMWAVIGIYTGREDNIFWRRIETENGHHIEAAGAKSLSARDCAVLGRDVIHSVINPIPRLTAALHVYGGDFFGMERSEWDPETLAERRFDVEAAARRFEESNATLARGQ
jgi:predicted metal-dependent enzyme (double-stranded beta helix superfamily)